MISLYVKKTLYKWESTGYLICIQWKAIISSSLRHIVASRRKKVNCWNFKKFFQLCVSLLGMISILVDSYRFLSLVVIQILNQWNLSLHI